MPTVPAIEFELPPGRVAVQPPEARGLARDEVRLMVARPSGLRHGLFHQIGEHLGPDDLLVVNNSPTRHSSLVGWLHGVRVDLHMSTLHDDGTWTVEVRQTDRSGPVLDAGPGLAVKVRTGTVTLVRPANPPTDAGVRLWRAVVDVGGGMRRLLARHGRPIRYAYVPEEWPLAAYQTVFANTCLWPGSAEMASAARPFTRRLWHSLRSTGVRFASVTLHSGVSSQEAPEPPQPEWFAVPQSTADLANATRAAGGRVIAVGTTTTRALASAMVDGEVRADRGWTDVVLAPDSSVDVIDGLITGWHPASASHLGLLQAVAGPHLVAEAYRVALEGEYLWHEFGDSCLLLRS